jgi:hypothetical protein
VGYCRKEYYGTRKVTEKAQMNEEEISYEYVKEVTDEERKRREENKKKEENALRPIERKNYGIPPKLKKKEKIWWISTKHDNGKLSGEEVMLRLHEELEMIENLKDMNEYAREFEQIQKVLMQFERARNVSIEDRDYMNLLRIRLTAYALEIGVKTVNGELMRKTNNELIQSKSITA